MDHEFKTSSAIRGLSYDAAEKILTVHFHSSVHQFEGVSQNAFEEFKNCESAGKHFHAHIRGKFTERK